MFDTRKQMLTALFVGYVLTLVAAAYVIDKQDQELASNKLAFDQLANDMAINYALCHGEVVIEDIQPDWVAK